MANDEWIGAQLTRPSHRPVPSPSPYLVVGLFFFFVPTSIASYSIILSVMNCRFCGVLSNYHFRPREAGKSLMNSSSWDAFNAPNTCRSFVGLVPDKGVAFSSVHFFSYIYSAPSPFSSILSLLIIEKEIERDCRLLLRRFSFRQHIFCHIILRQSSVLPSKYLLTVSFHFLAFFV